MDFEEGTYRFTAMLMSMWSHAEHGVAPDQMEPGIALEDQAHDHVLDFGMYSLRLQAEYVVLDGLALDLRLPVRAVDVSAHFHDEEGAEIANFESIHHRDEVLFGLGDPEISGVWRVLEPGATQPWHLQLSIGFTVPLGDTEPDPFVLGQSGDEHQHIFFGTGTFDPVIGGEARYEASGWTGRFWARSRVSLYANSHGYTGPGVTQGGLGAMSPLGTSEFSFMAEVGAMHETPAKWGGEQAKNSGRTEFMVNLGASWFTSPNVVFSAMVKRPIYTIVLGGQMDIPLLAMLSVSYTEMAEDAPAVAPSQ